MVSATVDNTPVTVLLGNAETYTPATGSVQKVTALAHPDERLKIIQGGSTQRIVNTNSGSGEPHVAEIELLITDTETIREDGRSGGDGIYISGFEVN